jgi:hypothetical protein
MAAPVQVVRLPSPDQLTPSENDLTRAEEVFAGHTGVVALSTLERHITEVAVDHLAYLDLTDTEGLARCIRRIRALMSAAGDAELRTSSERMARQK